MSLAACSVQGMPQITPEYGVPSSERNSGPRETSQHDFNLISSALLGTSSDGEVSPDLQEQQRYNVGSSRNVFSSQSLSLEEMERAMGSPKVYKHISIHIPPKDEFEVPMKRVIRPMGVPDKHVNIIFVKAPSSSSSQNTEIILPEQNEQKTIVYVLLRKSEASSDIKIRQPEPAKPPRPEVFFVKYGSGEGEGQQDSQTNVGATGDIDSSNSRPQYGVPQ